MDSTLRPADAERYRRRLRLLAEIAEARAARDRYQPGGSQVVPVDGARWRRAAILPRYRRGLSLPRYPLAEPPHR